MTGRQGLCVKDVERRAAIVRDAKAWMVMGSSSSWALAMDKFALA
jgi:hypothetical protein